MLCDKCQAGFLQGDEEGGTICINATVDVPTSPAATIGTVIPASTSSATAGVPQIDIDTTPHVTSTTSLPTTTAVVGTQVPVPHSTFRMPGHLNDN